MTVAALIGSPVGHSLSPVIHNAAFGAAGQDWTYVAFDVPAGRADEALAAMTVLGLGGLSVTTPHKEQVADSVDVLDPAASALRSVNTVAVDDAGRLVGHSTDGDGFVASLAAAGIDVVGRRVVILGAGAAARSVVDALGRADAADVVIVNRTSNRARAAAMLAPMARVSESVSDDISGADIVVNATSVGFGAGAGAGAGAGLDALPLDRSWLRPEHVVADLVYHPLDTALLQAARAVGARALDGLGMLVHQAALQQRLWTGELPDVAVMRAAAEAELIRRAAS